MEYLDTIHAFKTKLIFQELRMSLTSAQKAETINTYKRSEADTGTSEVQVALMTGRIKYLTEHFKIHKKDFHSRRGLQALVNKRRKLLKYLKRQDTARYTNLIQGLGLRDSY
jgi:small subunit ribosomal protein S15